MGLDDLVAEIEAEGGSAEGHLLNAVEPDTIEDRIATVVEVDVGPIEVALFNLGAQIGNKTLNETTYKQFELGWRLATFSLFRMVRTVVPFMEKNAVAAPSW